MDTWLVISKKTGRKICECSEEKDAIMMVSFSPDERVYSRSKTLSDQIIDVTFVVDNQLPGQIGLPAQKEKAIESHKERLPEGQGIPIKIGK